MRRPPVAVGRPSLSEAQTPELIAAVDLGSNSFHMIIGECRCGQLRIVGRQRETVRLAEGLSANGNLSCKARSRALDCLQMFGRRLRELQVGHVSVAGTSTIRRVRADTSFLLEAEQQLGHPIEILEGIEEARLIYLGVVHSLPANDELRLVMDIGGGSTEVILGQAASPRVLESLQLGCVSMTERFFPAGKISEAGFKAARLAAHKQLQPLRKRFGESSSTQAIGASGTIRSAYVVAKEMGLIESGFSAATLESLIEVVLGFDTVENMTLQGLSIRRAQVWPGGLSILIELLNSLGVAEMAVSDTALREGLLYDLAGRLERQALIGKPKARISSNE